MSQAPQDVVVIGGGLTGCEIALELHRTYGKNVAIVEMQDDLITTPGIALANTSFLRDYFKAKNVPVYLESKTTAINDDSVTIMTKDGKTETIPADKDSFIMLLHSICMFIIESSLALRSGTDNCRSSNFVSTLIFSVSALTPDGRLTDNAIAENGVRRAMLASSRRRILMLGSQKVGEGCLETLCHLKDIDYVVSERDLSPTFPDFREKFL